ncbi:hypothetical protein ACFSHP_24585 [Novosphingobium panipatense]
MDSEGNLVWQRSLGTAGSARGAAVTLAPNGEIVVAGTASSGDEIQGDMLVARFNAKGQELSNTVIRQVGAETASAVTVGRDGSIFVAGRASSGGDAVIVKLDSAGKLIERRTIDSGGSDSVAALAIDGEGAFLPLRTSRALPRCAASAPRWARMQAALSWVRPQRAR